MKLSKLFSFLAFALAIAAPSLVTAQTTYTFGRDGCSAGSVDCFSVPIKETGTSVWINLSPFANPTSSRFIDRIPDFPTGTYAEVNLDSTYQVTYAGSVTYKATDGRTWIADIPAAQPIPPCYSGQPCHTHQVPLSISLSFSQINSDGSVPPNPLNGAAVIQIGDWYYVDQCSGRGCGGSLGWHWYVTGGSVVVGPTAQVHSDIFIGYSWTQYCNWAYQPTGNVNSTDGIEVGSYCYWVENTTGYTTGTTFTTWWIPWTTWFLPFAQNPACESSNYASCNQYIDVPTAKQSTPQYPAR